MRASDHLIPRGGGLGADRWERRHQALLVVLALHAVLVPVLAMALGVGVVHTLLEAAGLAALTGAASLSRLGRRSRSVIVTFGLMTSSALVVHVSGGVTEAHFHFFVVIGLLALYEDWAPFAVSIAYVLLHHGILGAADPHAVFSDHPVDRAWYWAGVHALFIGGAAVVNLISWHLRSDVREDARRGERRYRAVVDGVSQVIFQTDRHGRWSFLNDAFADATGIPVREALGRPVLDFVHPEHRDDVTRLLTLREGRARAQVRSLNPDGTSRWYEARVHPASGDDGIFGTLVDITATRESAEQLVHLALHDPLTGLPNRSLFLDRLDHAIAAAERDDRQVAVLFIDVDEFKAVNDELGHQGGDALLRVVADVLSDEIRAGDTAARLGGDEFAVICDGAIDREGATDVARRIHARFDHKPTVSIGVAMGGAGTPAENLLHEADAAMYRAKAAGRDGFAIFDETMRTSALERQERASDLRRALATGELSVRYLPFLALDTGRIVGFEAVPFWEHPEHGEIAPEEFLPIAEESGLIVELGGRIIDAACAQVADWQSANPDHVVKVTVNLSAREVEEPGMPDRVEAAVRRTGIDASQLHLEITEGVIAADDRRTIAALERLAAFGVHLVLDGFGIGASSLSALTRFPLDAVKIDRSLLAAADEETLIAAVAAMVKALGLLLAAEGVDHADQASRLAALGCDYAQGAVAGAPLSAEEARAVLSAQRSAAGQTIR